MERGRSRGCVAAYCLAHGTLPRNASDDAATLRAFQHALLDAGVPLFWWTDVTYGDPFFKAVHMLGVSGIAGGFNDMTFKPDDPLTADDQAAIEVKVGKNLDWPASDLSRGQAAIWLLQTLEL